MPWVEVSECRGWRSVNAVVNECRVWKPVNAQLWVEVSDQGRTLDPKYSKRLIIGRPV